MSVCRYVEFTIINEYLLTQDDNPQTLTHSLNSLLVQTQSCTRSDKPSITHSITQADVRLLTQTLNHSLIHSETGHSLTLTDIRSLTLPDTRSLTLPDTHSLTLPDTRSLTLPDGNSYIHLLNHSVTLPDTHTLTLPDTHSHIHSLNHSVTRSNTHSFTHTITQSVT